MDVQKNPKAMAALQPMLEGFAAAFGVGSADASDAAKEAVSDDMGAAMMNYMPLRGITSFSGGSVTYDQLKALTDQINNS